MATYIQLLILTPGGRERALEDPQSVMRAQQAVATPDIQVLGVYAVLGEYDFVNIVAADDNEAIARFSLKLGVRAGAHITTLPAFTRRERCRAAKALARIHRRRASG